MKVAQEFFKTGPNRIRGILPGSYILIKRVEYSIQRSGDKFIWRKDGLKHNRIEKPVDLEFDWREANAFESSFDHINKEENQVKKINQQTDLKNGFEEQRRTTRKNEKPIALEDEEEQEEELEEDQEDQEDQVDKDNTRHAVDVTVLAHEFTSILDIFRFAVTEFTKAELTFGHTTLTPWEDASFLILHELALPIQDPIEKWGSAKLTKEERKHLLTLIQERIRTRKPTPYLVNGCYQQGEYFYIDERALIPRSFIGDIIIELTAAQGKSRNNQKKQSQKSQSLEFGYEDYFGEIVDEKKFHNPVLNENQVSKPITAWKQRIDVAKVQKVLDLCTGSGCLAILTAKYFPNIQKVDAVDLSKAALEVAEINVLERELDPIITLYEGNLFRPLKNLPNKLKYNLILANPPYVKKQSMKQLPKEYQHEPSLALDGGKDGLDVVRRIIENAKDYLEDDGFLICEIGDNKKEFEKYYQKFHLKDSNFPSHELQWIETKNSKEEVFIVSKEHLIRMNSLLSTTKDNREIL